MAYVNDSYDLNYSEPVTLTDSEDETADLELFSSDLLPLELFGYVYSTTKGGAVIANAYVTVYDEFDAPVTTAYTDASGYYAVTTLSAGDYKVGVSAKGYTASELAPVTLDDVPVQQDIVLQPYSDTDRVIYGIITDAVTTDPILGARIDVVNSIGAVVASTTSIGNGGYAVYGLDDDDYTVIASVSGYSAESGTATISGATPFVEVDLAFTAYYTPLAVSGTISGFITDTSSDPIKNAWVGLYSESAGFETLVASTSTSASGYYIFEDVAPGDYVVKAKMQA